MTEAFACFGLASAISANSSTCQSCARRMSCHAEALSFVQSLPETPAIAKKRQALVLVGKALRAIPHGGVGGKSVPLIKKSVRGVRRVLLDASQLDQIATFPPRVASQLKQLLERGWFDFAKGEIRAGRNPADKGWKKVFCELLINGNATRRDLELAFVEQLDMSPGSARAQVSVGISIFAAGRLATEVSGRVVLNPN